MEVERHLFFTSPLGWGKCSASRSGLFIPSVKVPSTHSTAGWVGPRGGPNFFEEKKCISFVRIQIPNRHSPGPGTGKFIDQMRNYQFLKEKSEFLLITNLAYFFMYLFISSLYMFRASQCSSSGDRIVLLHHLVWLVCVTAWYAGEAYQAVTYTD